MYGMELIESNPDPTKSAVMSRAAELVGEGYDRSAATSMAWDDILGEDYGEDEDDEEISTELLGLAKKSTRRKNTMNNPIEGDMGTIAMFSGLGYLLWCAIAYKKHGTWSWAPWKPVAPVQIARRIAPPRRIGYDPIPDDNHGAEYITLIVP